MFLGLEWTFLSSRELKSIMGLVVTMKKLLAVTLSFLLCTGCNSSKSSSSKSDSETETFTSDVTQSMTDNTSTTVDTNVTDDMMSDIQVIDLNLPENNSYLEYNKEFTYGNKYSLSDGRKIVEDTNLYLEDLSGNKTAILKVPEEDTQKYVVFGEMIDDNRFSYYIINHETTGGSGVYNLENGEDFRIDVCEDHSAYIPVKAVDNYLYFSKDLISDFRGIGKLNHDTYEFTELDCSALLDNDTYYLGSPALSPDGTKAAVYGIVSGMPETNVSNEYQVAIYSLTDEEIIATYNFFSEHDYVNYQSLYHNDDDIFLYLSQYGDDPQNHLYIIDVTK